MPSALNPAGTSIVLINFMVLTSNIDGCGWSLVKPWPVFGHTVAPLPPTPGIMPTGSSVSRSKIVNRFSNAGTAGLRLRRRLRLRRAARDVQPAADGVRVDVVRAALAADARGLQHFVRARLFLFERRVRRA